MDQLLREWPPGFGGIERVAHGLGKSLGGKLYCLNKAKHATLEPFEVQYCRRRLLSIRIGRLLLPLPTFELCNFLFSRRPLLAHLPCPTVLFLVILARCFRRNRSISIYWHSFILARPGFVGILENLYQWLAINLVKPFPIITTSPVLVDALIVAGISNQQVQWLPCSLTAEQESCYESISLERKNLCKVYTPRQLGNLIAIGRLDSYKRIDWLIKSFCLSSKAIRLDLIGDGPDRFRLEALVNDLLPERHSGKSIVFHGRASESDKAHLLAKADLLVLPADRCNEAFGIVQLEAMASGIPAIAFDLPRSGMHWVSKVEAVSWSGKSDQLAELFDALFSDYSLYLEACRQSKQRYLKQFSLAQWHKRLQDLGLVYV